MGLRSARLFEPGLADRSSGLHLGLGALSRAGARSSLASAGAGTSADDLAWGDTMRVTDGEE